MKCGKNTMIFNAPEWHVMVFIFFTSIQRIAGNGLFNLKNSGISAKD
jgi:hypothetical protein